MAPVARSTRPFYLTTEVETIDGYGVRFPDGTVCVRWEDEGCTTFWTDESAMPVEISNQIVWGAPGLVVIEEDGLRDVILRTLWELASDATIKPDADIGRIGTERIMTAINAALRMGGELPDGSIDPQ